MATSVVSSMNEEWKVKLTPQKFDELPQQQRYWAITADNVSRAQNLGSN